MRPSRMPEPWRNSTAAIKPFTRYVAYAGWVSFTARTRDASYGISFLIGTAARLECSISSSAHGKPLLDCMH